MELTNKKSVIENFAQHATDTGSSEVQIALLTKGILELTEHCKKNKKDFSSKRGLLRKVEERKRHLKYLQNTAIEKYKLVIERLGLRR